MSRNILRVILSIIGAALGYVVVLFCQWVASGFADIPDTNMLTNKEAGTTAIIFAIIFILLFNVLVPALDKRSKELVSGLADDLSGVSGPRIIGGTVGLIFGFAIAALLTKVYQDLTNPYIYLIITVLSFSILGHIGYTIGNRRGPDIISDIRGQGKVKTKGSRKGQDLSPKILDTSVIIDGRILEIMKTGFLEGEIVIPEFVLVELRHIADSSDALKRARGRRGLDILNKMQKNYGIEIYNTDEESAIKGIPEVDVKLLKLAQIKEGKVVTNDFNLNKVGKIQGIPILNINELANAIKPIAIPGETMNVTLVKEGKDQKQGVAYLDDGTMIVVEDGKKRIGETCAIVVTSVIQTSAGRMIFGRLR
ncbi:MAG: TRAM domain-containing protein [Clostridia bacterium]|nr:TRAM domain-containing protein [Clostridia bacterium]